MLLCIKIATLFYIFYDYTLIQNQVIEAAEITIIKQIQKSSR